MRPLIFCLIFISCLIGLYLWQNTVAVKPILLKPQDLGGFQVNPNQTIVAEMNAVYRQVKNIVYPKITIRSQGAKLEACLLYEKERKFRMVNWSIFGKESEIGSDDTQFWFWSKRMDPPALYYAKHEDLSKTYLKTPFHPNWLMEMIGVNEVSMENSSILNHNGRVAIVKKALSINGSPLLRVYLIDPVSKAYVGHYLFDGSWNPIASAEITQHHVIGLFHVPKEMTVIWYEEKIASTWSFDAPQINSSIDPKNWEQPQIQQKINLDGYAPAVTVSQVF
jgi:hypothetical protein